MGIERHGLRQAHGGDHRRYGFSDVDDQLRENDVVNDAVHAPTAQKRQLRHASYDRLTRRT